MLGKRSRPPSGDDGPSRTKRRQCLLDDSSPGKKPAALGHSRDHLSRISDEITLRILSYLPISTLLDLSRVSHHLHRLSSDSQIWRALYYSRFVLPRAMRIPGFRDGSKRAGSRLHYSARRAVWADGGLGKRGALVDMRQSAAGNSPFVDWKRQYKLRHNWASGKATVEELEVGGGLAVPKRTLAKVVEGIAVTADAASGLRIWDLRTKAQIAQIGLGDDDGISSTPTCLAVDDRNLGNKKLDVCLGFLDGSFGVWRLDLGLREVTRRYRHAKSSNGELVGVAFQHPFLVTATDSVLISLYDFDGARHDDRRRWETADAERAGNATPGSQASSVTLLDLGYDSDETLDHATPKEQASTLPAPVLMTSLKSHSSRAPLALSIRSMVASVVASIAYTFPTRDGWSIGIQDLHIRPSRTGKSEVASSRLAYTLPITSNPAYSSLSQPPVTPSGRSEASPRATATASHPASSPIRSPSPPHADGPTTLCYNHPYLLATLPDNTLVLHVCTSDATALSMSPGIRLWGHTSGISDAEITARGKAVSVSCRGEEIRVWELEGRAGGNSIEVRPNLNQEEANEPGETPAQADEDGWDDRRNWVGFDDEMVIVLKEARDGRESLVVYDFT